jgi:hypothetical protein
MRRNSMRNCFQDIGLSHLHTIYYSYLTHLIQFQLLK